MNIEQLKREHAYYKEQLGKIVDFWTAKLHPYYGQCDGLNNGNCSECTKVLNALLDNQTENAGILRLGKVIKD